MKTSEGHKTKNLNHLSCIDYKAYSLQKNRLNIQWPLKIDESVNNTERKLLARQNNGGLILKDFKRCMWANDK